MVDVVSVDINTEEAQYLDSISVADYEELARRCNYHKGGHQHYKKQYFSARKYIRALILVTAFLSFITLAELIFITL